MKWKSCQMSATISPSKLMTLQLTISRTTQKQLVLQEHWQYVMILINGVQQLQPVIHLTSPSMATNIPHLKILTARPLIIWGPDHSFSIQQSDSPSVFNIQTSPWVFDSLTSSWCLIAWLFFYSVWEPDFSLGVWEPDFSLGVWELDFSLGVWEPDFY